MPIDATGGVAPYSFTVSGLPQGLNFDGSNITGASTVPGDYPVTLYVTDDAGQTAEQTVTLTVSPPPTIALGAPNIPASGQVSAAYSGSVSASGGYGSLAWTASNLPPGLNVSAAGTISGTPTTAGTFNPIFTVVDESGQSAQVSGNLITINTPLQPDFTVSATSLANVKRGSSVSDTITVAAVNGFKSSVSFTVSGLPKNTTTSFSPSSVMGQGSSTLKVTTKKTSPTGTYPLTVTAQSSNVVHAVSVNLTIQ